MNAQQTTPHIGTGRQPTSRRRLETELGPLGYQEVGAGPPLVFLAGAMANGDLWLDVVQQLQDRYRCLMLDLPLGAHRWPLNEGSDRSPRSLARLILDALVLLDVRDAAVVANDTAGGLTLLALDEDHPGRERIGALVLTNCESFEHFPPDSLRNVTRMCRRTPRLARWMLRRSVRSSRGRRKFVRSVAATSLDDVRAESFFAGVTDRRIADDLVRAFAGIEPSILLAAAPALERFDRPVLLAWGDTCKFFPVAHAERLAAAFPAATLTIIKDAQTWVPLDQPTQLAAGITTFLSGQAAA
jgi:pimeloyl-ACP methyl ester carboxylesterase